MPNIRNVRVKPAMQAEISPSVELVREISEIAGVCRGMVVDLLWEEQQ
jgi:hypothetical protein